MKLEIGMNYAKRPVQGGIYERLMQSKSLTCSINTSAPNLLLTAAERSEGREKVRRVEERKGEAGNRHHPANRLARF
jgi:hypothetical protein